MTLTTVRAGAFIHHIKLLSENPERLAAFYGDAMDMAIEQVSSGEWLCTGPNRRVVIGKGQSKRLDYGAFGCRDREGLNELRQRAQKEGLKIEPSPTPLLDKDAFGVRDPDNNLILFGMGIEERPSNRPRLNGPIQHLTLATRNLEAFEAFYAGKLGFAVSDRVRQSNGQVTTVFTRSNHEHHTLAAFLHPQYQGIDHHSYEAGEWQTIRDWCDYLGDRRIPLMWGPGRHGPGNNIFIFIEDPDGNWIEISAELEVIYDRPVKEWPHEPHTLNRWGEAIMRVGPSAA